MIKPWGTGMIQESLGIQLENFITPIADNAFRLLTPTALTGIGISPK
jgi:hypothetical protein